MHIAQVTWRHRNDFHFIAYCRHCGKTSRWGDGYADERYQLDVFPNRHCPECNRNEAGEPEPSDPDRQHEDRDERRRMEKEP